MRNTLVLGLFLLASCKTPLPHARELRDQVNAFHEIYNRELYQDLYKTLSPSFRSRVSVQQFIRTEKINHGRFGNFISCSLIRLSLTRISTVSHARVVDARCSTRFSHGETTEGFTFVLTGNSPSIESYEILDTEKGKGFGSP